MTRPTDNKNGDDASFKTLLARLDDGFDAPLDLDYLTEAPVKSTTPKPRRRGMLWASVSAGTTAAGLAALIVYPWLSQAPSVAGGNTDLATAATGLTTSFAPGDVNAPIRDANTASPLQIHTAGVAIIDADRPQYQPGLPPPAIRQAQAAPGSASAPQAEKDGPPVPLTRQRRPAEALSDVKLLIAPSQRARAGDSTPVAIKIDTGGMPAERLRVVVQGLSGGATLSPGVASTAGVWLVPVASIEQLQLRLPVTVGDDMTLSLELQDVDGNSLARALTVVSVLPAPPQVTPPQVVTRPIPAPVVTPPPQAVQAPPPASPSPPAASAQPSIPRLTMDEHTALIERGRLLIRNGDIASARLMFERAADGGSGRAALLLGETYDPDVLVSLGVLGAKGDPAKARRWYTRASELGMPMAAERLRALAGR